MTNNQDRTSRQSARAPISALVKYENNGKEICIKTQNISKGGAFINTVDESELIKVGESKEFNITFTDDPEQFNIIGEVVRIVSGAKPEACGMAIMFSSAEDNSRRKFEIKIEEDMVDSLGKELFAKLSNVRVKDIN